MSEKYFQHLSASKIPENSDFTKIQMESKKCSLYIFWKFAQAHTTFQDFVGENLKGCRFYFISVVSGLFPSERP
jgi:hypothetical protein